MPKKIIKLIIEENDFPMLFKIKNDYLSDLCYNIFDSGYKSHFNTTTHKLSLNTDSIKYDILQLKQMIQTTNIEDKVDKFSTIIEQLLGINMNVTQKGKVGEDFIYKLINQKFPDYNLEITRNKPHTGDAIMTIPFKNKNHLVMIEIKNYSKTVASDELQKLLYDMNNTSTKYSLFISLKSSFIGKKRLCINEYTLNSKTYIVLFIPNALNNPYIIENGIIMIERLMEYENTMTDLYNINEYLDELQQLYNNFSLLKNSYLSTETSIKDQLCQHYKSIREYEINFKNLINNIWLKIDNNITKNDNIELLFDKYKDEFKKSKFKLLKSIFEMFHKYDIHTNCINIYSEQLVLLYLNKKTIGTILIKKMHYNIDINDISIELKKNSSNIKKMDLLENILRNL